MFDVIDKSTLKPGDVVGIRMKTQIGWGVLPLPEDYPPDYRAYHPGSYQVRHDQRGRVRQERHLLSRYRRDEP